MFWFILFKHQLAGVIGRELLFTSRFCFSCNCWRDSSRVSTSPCLFCTVHRFHAALHKASFVDWETGGRTASKIVFLITLWGETGAFCCEHVEVEVEGSSVVDRSNFVFGTASLSTGNKLHLQKPFIRFSALGRKAFSNNTFNNLGNAVFCLDSL